MTKNNKHMFALTALTLAAGPAYAAETQSAYANTETSVRDEPSAHPVAAPNAPQPIFVRAKDIDVEKPDLAVINSAGLAFELTFHPKEALKLLNEVSPLNLADVSLDENGRVIVQDAAFVAKLQHAEGGETHRAGINIICGYDC